MGCCSCWFGMFWASGMGCCQGANMKLVVNAILGAIMVSFAEGMSLADEVRGCWCWCSW